MLHLYHPYAVCCRYTIPAFLFTNVCKLVGTQNLVKKGSKVERVRRAAMACRSAFLLTAEGRFVV